MKHVDEISAQEFIENGKKDEAIRAHLVNCQCCAKIVEDFENLFSVLRKTDLKDFSISAFAENTALAIRKKREKEKRADRLWNLLYFFAASLCAFVFFYVSGISFNIFGQFKNTFTTFINFAGSAFDFKHTGIEMTTITALAVLIAAFFTEKIFFRKLRGKN